jgi:DNA transposition AAA+ family ATPase
MTSNMMAAYEAYTNLEQAALDMTPAMGLFSGEAGLGKTTAGGFLFVQANGVLVRCRRADTISTFFKSLAKDLGLETRWGLAQNLDIATEGLAQANKPLFIDECDYIAENVAILESIRDIYDTVNIPIVLIGYAKLPKHIRSMPQLASRVAEHVEFKPATLEDTALMASELIPQITLSECLLAHINAETRGNYRRIHTSLSKVEKFAEANQLAEIDKDAWGNNQLFAMAV